MNNFSVANIVWGLLIDNEEEILSDLFAFYFHLSYSPSFILVSQLSLIKYFIFNVWELWLLCLASSGGFIISFSILWRIGSEKQFNFWKRTILLGCKHTDNIEISNLWAVCLHFKESLKLWNSCLSLALPRIFKIKKQFRIQAGSGEGRKWGH